MPQRTVLIVEGASDRVALETLALRQARDLAAEGVEIVPIGGAHSIGRFLTGLGGRRSEVRLAGLCDAGEERNFQRALEQAGLGADLGRAEMERLGFYVCVADLEDELIRSLGTAAVEAVLEAEGELRSFRSFQKQPAQRARTVEQHLRRFMGTRAGRKAQYARALVLALDLTRVPRPLMGVLAVSPAIAPRNAL